MKLGKEEIQKIFLSILLLIGLLYAYFTMLLDPLSKQEENAKKTVADLAPKIAAAKSLIKDVAQREKDAPKTNETLDQIKSMIPEGAPIAWFPPLITGFMKRQGIDKCTIHMGGDAAEKDLPGFKKMYWNLEMPHVDLPTLGIAIAALENQEPLLEVSNVQISASRDDVQYQSARVTLSTIVKQ